MSIKRDVLIFLAGAEFFHTLSHIILPFFIKLPFDAHFMVLTKQINLWVIIINAIITVLLLWWVSRLKY